MKSTQNLVLNVPVADTSFLLKFKNINTYTYFKKRFQTIPSQKVGSGQYQLTVAEMPNEYLLTISSNDLSCKIKKTTPLESLYFTIQALIQYSLLSADILFLHASSAIKSKSSYLFMAPSGSGKSTLVKNFPENQILSDDIAILKKMGDKFLVYTSVFDNKYFKSPPLLKAPLDKIFFIKKASFTSINKIGTTEEKLNIILHNNLLFWFMEIQKTNNITFSNPSKQKLYDLAFDVVRYSEIDILYLKKDNSFLNLI